jgi:transcriptional regulator with XRE-family HTH domain
MLRVKLNREFVEMVLARRNLSQNGLARNLGVSSGYISQIMTGRRFISAKMRQRMLRYFRGYTFNDLFIIEDGKRSAQNRCR